MNGTFMHILKSIAALSSLISAVVATPVLAQDQKQDFDGFYVGGSFGFSAQPNDRGEFVVFDTNRDGAFDDTVRTTLGADAFSTGFCHGKNVGRSAGEGCTSDKDNVEYAIRAGVDKQYGNMVVGFLVEGSKSKARDFVTAFSTTPAAYSFSRELDYAVSARGRVGYTPGGVLFYATGGASYGRIKNGFTTTNPLNSFANNGDSYSFGYQAGGGAEAKITKNITLGLEYLYSSYKDDDFVVNVGPGTAPATNPFLIRSGGTNMRRSDSDFNTHNIRLTTTFRF